MAGNWQNKWLTYKLCLSCRWQHTSSLSKHIGGVSAVEVHDVHERCQKTLMLLKLLLSDLFIYTQIPLSDERHVLLHVWMCQKDRAIVWGLIRNRGTLITKINRHLESISYLYFCFSSLVSSQKLHFLQSWRENCSVKNQATTTALHQYELNSSHCCWMTRDVC